MRSLSISGLAAAFVLLTFAIPHAAGAMNTTVNITDTAFIGKSIDILPGDTVTWVNAGVANHSVTADNGSFGSGTLTAGKTYSQVFTAVGSYPYHDGFNAAMVGTVRVVQQTPIPVSAPVPTQSTVTTNTSVNSQTQSLYAQVIALQQLLAQLQGNQGQSGGGTVSPTVTTNTTASSGACPRIGRVLKPGMSGDDVLRLQQFLAADASVYPEGQATGYYGALTQAAVQRWQIKFNIVSTGTLDSTGFGMVGPRTAAAIALQCSNSGGSSAGATAPVGGFIQVTPVSGVAPLAVSVQAHVNTVNSCQSATYILDWGDGSTPQSIPVSANTCKTLQQTYTHSYQYGGTYTVKLSAGGHESTATVVVSGPARPSGTGANYGGLVVTAPVGGQNFTAGQTISIAWQANSALPAGATIIFDLYTGTGQKVSASDVIAISSFPSGSFNWQIPLPGGACAAIYPGKLCGAVIPTGSYKIVAKAYQPSTGGNTYGPQVAEASSGSFTIIASNGSLTDTFTASATSGQPPLAVTFAGKVSSANQGWCEGGCFNLLQYGDGGSDFIALPTTAGTSASYSISHTYQSAGVYTAKLYQSQSATGPTVGNPITITVGNAGANFTYGPLEVGPGDSASPLSVSATFDIKNNCDKYRVSWGDGTPDAVQTNDGCTTTPVVKSVLHTYAQAGAYTISLARGPAPEKTDSIGITISAN